MRDVRAVRVAWLVLAVSPAQHAQAQNTPPAQASSPSANPTQGQAGAQPGPSTPGSQQLSPASTAARSAEEDSQLRAAARDLAEQGAEAFDAGDFSTALDRFNRAAALVAAPTLSVMQARSLVALGRWLEGLEKYREASRQALTPDASEPFQQAVREAQREGDELAARLPRLEIRIDPKAVQAEVLLDGKLVPRALLNVQHPVDPGPHRLQASVEGQAPFVAESTLAAAQQWIVEVPTSTRAAPPPQPAPAAPPRVNSLHPPTPDAPVAEQRWTWVAPVAFSVAGAGAGAALVAGFLAADKHTQLERTCTDGDCPPDSTSDLDAFTLYRSLCLVSSAVAVVGAGVGTYFVLWHEPAETTATFELTPVGARVLGRF